MAFLEQRLDARVTRGAQGGPTVPGRQKTYLPSGKLTQSFGATMAVHKYDLTPGLRSVADFEKVRALWYVVMFTPYEGFRFKDWGDYQATKQNTRLTKVAPLTWQMQRVYSIGGLTFVRDIRKPCASPAPVLFDSTGAGIAGAIDTTTGLVTLSGTPATWQGEFDVPVTFTDDDLPASWEVGVEDLHMQASAIKLEEVR